MYCGLYCGLYCTSGMLATSILPSELRIDWETETADSLRSMNFIFINIKIGVARYDLVYSPLGLYSILLPNGNYLPSYQHLHAGPESSSGSLPDGKEDKCFRLCIHWETETERQAGRRGHIGLHRSKEAINSRDGYHNWLKNKLVLKTNIALVYESMLGLLENIMVSSNNFLV